ncbi:MAG: hypothetical protein HY712_05160 [candidate division NC10 bacterium]|nr:hypothetical protein [candidate division NC10 bacterium]
MREARHPGEPAPAPAAGHEQRDLSPRAIALFGIALAATVVVCLILAVWLFDYFAAREAKRDVPRSPLATAAPPGEPRLQVFAPRELQALRAREDEMLESYGWVDKGAGIVRIPIDQAMELLAKRGLPASPKESAPPAKAKRQ